MEFTLHGIAVEVEVEHEPAYTGRSTEECTPEYIDYRIVGAMVEDEDELELRERADLIDADEKELISYLETLHDEIMEEISDQL